MTDQNRRDPWCGQSSDQRTGLMSDVKAYYYFLIWKIIKHSVHGHWIMEKAACQLCSVGSCLGLLILWCYKFGNIATVSWTLIQLKTCGTMSFEQFRPRWRCTAYLRKHLLQTVKHSGGLKMIRACFTAPRHEHLAVIELTMTKSRVKCEAIFLTAKVWLKLGHETGQTQQQIYNRMSEKRKESMCGNQ